MNNDLKRTESQLSKSDKAPAGQAGCEGKILEMVVAGEIGIYQLEHCRSCDRALLGSKAC
jgi:hypothetical protein